MVLGIGEGRIEIMTEKFSYGSGETLMGKVILQVNAPKKARALRIQFYGVRKLHSYSGGKHRTRTETIMKQELVLDGEREHQTGTTEYPFEFRLPSIPRPVGGGDALVNLADPYGDVKWYLDASLDIPLSFDINKKQILNFVR